MSITIYIDKKPYSMIFCMDSRKIGGGFEVMLLSSPTAVTGIPYELGRDRRFLWNSSDWNKILQMSM